MLFMLFSHSLRGHITRETTNHAKVAHNDSIFSMTKENLKQYAGVLFPYGYHSLPQHHLYWERHIDVKMPIVYQTIGKTKFKTIKEYTHLADNSNLDRQDKYAKVHPLYHFANKFLKQFG